MIDRKKPGRSLKKASSRPPTKTLIECPPGERRPTLSLVAIEAEKLPPVKTPEYKVPATVPASYEEHLKLMTDLLVLAFQADVTRVCTFMLANEGSNRSYRNIGVSEGHHTLSHHDGDHAKDQDLAYGQVEHA